MSVLPDRLGFSKLNKPVNIVYVHNGLALKFKQKGWGPMRAVPGILVEHTSQEKVKELQEYQLEVAAGSNLYPPTLGNDL